MDGNVSPAAASWIHPARSFVWLRTHSAVEGQWVGASE